MQIFNIKKFFVPLRSVSGIAIFLTLFNLNNKIMKQKNYESQLNLRRVMSKKT